MEPQSVPIKKTIKVRLYLEVENNSKFVRGKKRAREDIEMFVLDYYSVEKISEDEYELIISYENDEGLENEIGQIFRGMSSHADTRNCYIEADISEVDGERRW